MLNNEQIQKLQQNLHQEAVSKRPDGMSYVESHYVISMANEIFGYDGWAYTVNDLSYVDAKGKNGIFQAVVTVQVNADGQTVARTDVGYGIPTSDSAQAYENAGKTAVTDAMKRAFRTFGNRFGNGLYASETSFQSSASDEGRESIRPKPARDTANPPVNIVPAKLPPAPLPVANHAECEACGGQVKGSVKYSVPQVVAFSKRTYGGHVLCYDCQKQYPQNMQAAA